MPLERLIPGPPGWNVDWEAICDAFPLVSALWGTPHDPVHHAEGCPWVHTRLVCEEMAGDDRFRALDPAARLVAFLTAVLHDVAKPVTASVAPDGRVRHPGHSRVGANMARVALWELGVEPGTRERVCNAISLHQVPFWLLDRDWVDVRRLLVAASLSCGNDILSLQAAADARGRKAPDAPRMVENVELYRMAAEEAGCLASPFPVADGATLRAFMDSPGTVDPTYPMPRPATLPRVTVMSGLPGAGKSTWLERNLKAVPVVSLDAVRDRLGIPPEKPQGEVIFAARVEAHGYLRSGVDFAWDATCLSKDVRGSILSMCRKYGYATRLVVVEASPSDIRRRFKDRDRGVPKAAFDRLLRRWDPPTCWEADEVIAPWMSPIENRMAGIPATPATL